MPFGISLDPATNASVQSTPQGVSLLTKLTKQLETLKDQLDKGDTPDPQLLQQLGQTAQALTALIAPPAAPVSLAPTLDLSTTLDPLTSIGSSADKGKTDPLAGLAGSKNKSPVSDQITQFLASLGLGAPATPSDPAAQSETAGAIAAPTAAQPLPAIAELASKLAELGAAIAPVSPDVAKQLQALNQKLTAAEANPQTLAPLTAGSSDNATALDQIVRSLLDAKPAANAPQTPSVAAPKLDIPAPIAPTAPKSPTVAPPAPVTGKTSAGPASTNLRSPLVGKTADPSQDDPSRPDTKIIAAATSGVDAKSNAPDSATQVTTATIAAPAATGAARAIPAAYQAATNPINMAQVAFEMVRQAHQGSSRFSIRIDPPELGRVDVRMHVDATGNVNARLTVERSETLDMFQRDRGSLEKALSQAGLDAGKTNLEFSLKQNPFAGMTGGDQRQGGTGPLARYSPGAEADDTLSAIPSVTLYRGIASAGGVNLFV
ncbi:MAG: flagellar hook-length control protein FliK [Devosia sp.]